MLFSFPFKQTYVIRLIAEDNLLIKEKKHKCYNEKLLLGSYLFSDQIKWTLHK